ncbi:MAG: dethiobiotin synthase [Magnetococcales bacterium]|nr:dethiobiotin synthase [Magnetococcales bacterium]
MSRLPSQPLFLTGTDTDVGKSVVAAWLMVKMAADYWKPIQAGLQGETDSEAVRRLSGLPASRFHPATFNLDAPLSPHESARREGVEIRLEDFHLPLTPNPLIVEGAGGLLVPLNHQDYMVDLIQTLALPVVLVARSTLGTINHTLLSLALLRERNIPLLGVILNGPPRPENRQAIESYGKVEILAEIPTLPTLDSRSLSAIP